ncbi:MAG: SRPBCC domain-containing protein [Pseudomonadota bacterium]
MTVQHETLRFDRRFQATPAALFAAYADTEVRQAWSAPTPRTEVRIERCDLRAGGTEFARCGSPGDLKWIMQTAYHVVEPAALISFTEVLSEGAKVLTVALITFDIRADGTGSRLILTDQVTSFVGVGGVDGHRDGYTQALGNLGQVLVAS